MSAPGGVLIIPPYPAAAVEALAGDTSGARAGARPVVRLRQARAGAGWRRPGIDEAYAVAAVAIALGGVIGGNAVLFACAAGLVLVLDAPNWLRHGRELVDFRFLPLVLFLAVHLASGLNVGAEVLGHLLMQVAMVAAFAAPFFLRYRRAPMARFNRAFGWMVVAVVVGLIGWHLTQGRWSGWKSLGQTKTALSFLPVVMLAFVTARQGGGRGLADIKRPLWVWSLLAILVCCAVILLSGERKALAPLLVALLLLGMQDRSARNTIWRSTWRWAVVGLAALSGGLLLFLAARLDPNGYVGRQIASLWTVATGQGTPTLSSLQREWQVDYGLSLLAQNPLWGIGTRNYVPLMTETYQAVTGPTGQIILPGATLHGEGLRVLVENGVIGFLVWLGFIFSAVIMAVAPRRPPDGRRSLREWKITLVLLMAMLGIIAVEAYDTTTMIAYALLPVVGLLRFDDGRTSVIVKQTTLAKPRAGLAPPPPLSGPVVVHVLTRWLRAGSEENTLITAQAQAAAGWRVVIVHGRDFDPGMRDEAARMADLRCVEAMVHPVSPFEDLCAVWTLWRLFRHLRPDVVHTHQSKAGILGRLAAALAGVPAVIHGVHIALLDPAVQKGRGRLAAHVYRGAERLCAMFTDGFISVSPAVRDACLTHGLGAPHRHRVAHSAMDVARFSNAQLPQDWRTMLNVEGNKSQPPTVVMLAAFEPRKRHLDLIAALPDAFAGLTDWRLVLAGEGTTRAAAQALTRRLNLTDRVRFVGHRTDPEAVIALADVCLLTSEREGLPRVLVQYAAAGKAMVVSDLPGVRDLVENNLSAVITPSNDVAAAAQAVAKLLANPAERARLAGKAAALDLERWSASAMMAQIDAAYAEALRTSRRRKGRRAP